MTTTSNTSHLPPRPSRPPWPWGRTFRLLAGILLITYAWVMAALVPVPFIKVEPGSATNVLDLISVQDGPRHPADGDLLFLTVGVSHRLTPLEAVVAWLDDDTEIQPEKNYTGGLSRREITQINLAVMRESKLIAIKVALEHLGYQVDVLGGGAMITDVLPDRPASRVLEIGDVVVAVDGERVTFAEDVIERVDAFEPGDAIPLTIKRGENEQRVEVRTVAGDDGQAQIGIHLTNDLQFDFPFEIDINTGQVGGPSAGLAFALAVLDEVTEGELTGGHPVAVTGAIDADGRVQEVGGVEQKAVAARRAGAVLMIVPEREAELARAHAGDMDVAGAATLDEALAALDAIGGNALSLPRSGESGESVASATPGA